MAKVIRIDKKKAIRKSCQNCGAVVEFFQNEVQSFVHHDYGGGSDTIYYIVCPNCGKQIQWMNF